MSMYVKDSDTSTGWKVVSYSDSNKKTDDGAPVTAEGMDEGADEGGEENGPDASR